MSKGSKNAQSGLKTIQRDFSCASSSQSTDIPWPPSPKPFKRVLSGSEQRMKDIQDALAEVSNRSPLTTSSNLINKRSIGLTAENPPAKKPRQLPWDDTSAKRTSSVDSLTSTTTFAASSSALAKKGTKPSQAPHEKAKPKVAPVFLSQEQTQILKLVQDGESVFYTGSAGTGKSVLLREIIKTLRKMHVKSSDAVAITASTGIAACNIGGVTIHSFAGIGLGIEEPKELIKKIRKNKKATARWLRTKVLIIDEVSMVDGDLFDKLAKIGMGLRNNNSAPFGGIQVIVTGDFFQLPPVTKGSSSQVKFAFEAEYWSQTIKRTFNLTKVFRQRDQEFVNMLNEMRFGKLSHKSIATFRSLSRAITYEDGLGGTELFPRREDVDRANSTRMKNLGTEEKIFTASDNGKIIDPMQREKMLSNFMAPKTLNLRIDAQVMLIKNVDDTLVNGSMGKIVRFVDPASPNSELDGVDTTAKDGKKPSGKLYPVVQFAIPGGSYRTVMVIEEVWKVELPDGEVQVSRQQLPLILAWAMSIHKSQGQTLERVKVDLGKVFEKGQAYVALSRATSLEGLQVLNFDPNKVNAHPKVIAWSRTLETVLE